MRCRTLEVVDDSDDFYRTVDVEIFYSTLWRVGSRSPGSKPFLSEHDLSFLGFENPQTFRRMYIFTVRKNIARALGALFGDVVLE